MTGVINRMIITASLPVPHVTHSEFFRHRTSVHVTCVYIARCQVTRTQWRQQRMPLLRVGAKRCLTPFVASLFISTSIKACQISKSQALSSVFNSFVVVILGAPASPGWGVVTSACDVVQVLASLPQWGAVVEQRKHHGKNWNKWILKRRIPFKFSHHYFHE